MSALLLTFGVLVAALLGALLWSSGRKSRTEKSLSLQADCFTLPCQHVANLPQMRQSLELTDIEYLTARCTRAALKQVRQERRRVVLSYLGELRQDFDRLMEATSRIAAFSPEIEAKHEWRRFQLSLEFRARYALVRVKFAVGILSFPGLGNIVSMMSTMAVELERAMTEIAAASALADNNSGSTKS